MQISNCKLPLSLLLHLSYDNFEKVNPHPDIERTFDLSNKTEDHVIVELLNRAFALIVCWLQRLKFVMSRERFDYIYLREPHTTINFLRAMGIQVKCDEIQLSDYADRYITNTTYLGKNSQLKASAKHYKALLDEHVIQPEDVIDKYLTLNGIKMKRASDRDILWDKNLRLAV